MICADVLSRAFQRAKVFASFVQEREGQGAGGRELLCILNIFAN